MTAAAPIHSISFCECYDRRALYAIDSLHHHPPHEENHGATALRVYCRTVSDRSRNAQSSLVPVDKAIEDKACRPRRSSCLRCDIQAMAHALH